MKKLFCIFGLLLAAFSSEAAFISFTATNSFGAPDTNYLVLIPVSTVASGDGSFTTTGLPRRIYPDVNGVVVTNLMQNNWQVTNRFVNYVIRTPLDSGPTIYPAGQLLISSDSTGIGVFVTQQITFGGSNGVITLNQITNGLGFQPLAQTNLPVLTNGFITLLEATNVATAFANGSSNLLYSDYTTKLAIQSALTSTTSNALYADIQVISALGLTNAFATNAAGVSYANGRIYVSTNYDALGAATTAQLQAAITATNIATNFVFQGTNGFTSIVLSNAALFAGTNLVAITSNGLASAITTTAGISALTATNISTNQVFLATNSLTGLARSNALQVLFTNALPGLTNGFVDKSITNSAATIAYAQSLTNGFVDKSITNLLGLSKIDITNGFSTNLSLIGPHLTNGYFGGNGLIVLTNAVSDQTVPFFSHYDAANNDSFIIGHGGAEFFLGITNAATGSKSFIDGNINGEIEYNTEGAPSVLGSLFHRFYIKATNAVAIKYFEVGTNGVWATLYSGNASGLSNLNALQLTNIVPYSTLPTQILTNNLARPLTNNFGTRIGQWMLVTNPVNNSLIITNTTWGFASPIILGTNTSVVVNGSVVFNGPVEMGDNVLFDGDATVAGGQISSHDFVGDAGDLTNLTAAGISTNGSMAGQVITSIGGQSVWTNVTAVVGAGITNAYGTNTTTLLVTGQRVYIPTNFDIAGGSNFLFSEIANASNTLSANKVSGTNGFAVGLVATNATLEGDVGFGRDGLSTNITGHTTNFIAFYNAGSAIATNGAMLWISSLGVYTNFLTGAILTNNSTAWLLQTNGVTLYSIAGTSPIGTYSAVSGGAPAPNGTYTAALNDHMIMLGYFSVSNINQMFTNIFTNITTTTTNNFIANGGGLGTNTTLIYSNAFWGYSNALKPGSVLKPGQAILAGVSNTMNGAYSTMAGGFGNRMDSSGGFNFMGGGYSNYVLESSSAFIGGGNFNSIASDTGGTISGGLSNTITGSLYGTIPGGRNALVSNDNVFGWSDGTLLFSHTNSQAILSATNGLYVNGPIWHGFNNTNGGSYFTSNTVSTAFSLYAVTNCMPNFSYWMGESNGILVLIYYSNNVATMKNMWP